MRLKRLPKKRRLKRKPPIRRLWMKNSPNGKPPCRLNSRPGKPCWSRTSAWAFTCPSLPERQTRRENHHLRLRQDAPSCLMSSSLATPSPVATPSTHAKSLCLRRFGDCETAFKNTESTGTSQDLQPMTAINRRVRDKTSSQSHSFNKARHHPKQQTSPFIPKWGNFSPLPPFQINHLPKRSSPPHQQPDSNKTRSRVVKTGKML